MAAREEGLAPSAAAKGAGRSARAKGNGHAANGGNGNGKAVSSPRRGRGSRAAAAPKGLTIPRRWTVAGKDPFDQVEWELRTAVISGEKGEVVFEQKDVEVPAFWSQLATNVVASKYFRGPLGDPSRERSARQLIGRVAYTIAGWGRDQGYFATDDDAQAFQDELVHLLLHQKASFNSPVWFNCGIEPHPQCSACFINSVEDNMESILRLAATEARLFKGGSGTGSNLSTIRGSMEQLRGGGQASGPVSFMRGYDAFAGVIKCLTPDAYVLTDRGLRQIRDLIPEDLPAGFHPNESVVLATKDAPTRISHFYVSPEADTLRLRLHQTGLTLCGTQEHPVLTLTPEFRLVWKPLRDLAAGDRVAVARSTELWPEKPASLQGFRPVTKAMKKRLAYPEEVTPELARLLGYLVAEGSLDKTRFRFSNADEETFADFLSCVRAVFGVDPTGRVRRRVHPRTGVTTWQFEACWTNAVRFLEYAGLAPGRSADRRVPWSILSSPKPLVVEFLRAYFEGDGHVSSHVAASSASEALLREVQLLLLNMGIVSQLRPHRVKGHEYWCLSMRGEQAWLFVRDVGFISTRKRDAATLAGDKNTNIDVVPYLADVLRARASRNQYFRCADGTTRALSFGFINRKPGSGISYDRLRCTPSLVAQARALDPELADTLEVVLEREFFWDTVQSVEAGAPAVTYDFTVPDTHSFVANGIVNHNSGGKTRRAAKMVILNIDHPDIEEFIRCKGEEEKKAWALIDAGYDGGFNVAGGAYSSIFFQNANHSVRVTDDFMRAVENDGDWQTRAVLDGRVIGQYKARHLFRLIAEYTHICGDPGIQFHTTINDWHTCPNTAPINASNPCFTGDSLVYTNKGLVRFQDLLRRSIEGEEFQVYTHDATGEQPQQGVRLSSPTQYMVTGIHDTVRLKFSNGAEVTCTPNHRFFTRNRGMVRADELTSEDRLLMADAPCLPTAASWDIPVETDWRALRAKGDRYRAMQLPLEWSEGLAELLGHLTGDGSIGESMVSWVYGSPEDREELMPRHRLVLRSMGLDPNHCVQANGTEQLRITREPFLRFLESLGYRKVRAAEKRVPEALFQAPAEVVSAYLRGLFTADGCVRLDASKGYCYVGLGSRSEGLLVDVQRLLLMFGIQSHIHVVQEKPSSFQYQRRDGTEVSYSSLSPGYDLRITGPSLARFLSSVGFALSRKQSKLSEWVEGHRSYDVSPDVVLVAREDAGQDVTYNLTEPSNHSYIVNGFVVANCSEYMFLDDSACNLASLNLLRFRTPQGHFDPAAFEHACHIVFLAQEIIVDNASYPTPAIEVNSHAFRPLGLGYANLGALLMAAGVPYDSDAGRAYAGAVTALMNGAAYRMSARVAAVKGPFSGYSINRDPFLRVMRKHQAAVESIDADLAPPKLLAAARKAWEDVITLGEEHGFRNAQATVLAPTGTIGFMMDCDTTGIEPDIALVKYKKLVGGGVMKIVNQTVPEALAKLGYAEDEVSEIVTYIDEKDTIEGAPYLREEHLPVFDCAFRPTNGTRSIEPMGHIRMMAACQPFLSGAISKTVNVPADATAEDIEQCYLNAWKLGLKAVAIYRDGSKRTQPLNTSLKGEKALEGRPIRRKLPDERQAVTHKFSIAGHEGYITVGLYDDGQPGEVFLVMSKEGSVISGLMDSFATAISLALQYGVPLKELVRKFGHVRFEPAGFTGNPDLPIAKSIVDYIFRWMGLKFLPREDQPAPEQTLVNGNGEHKEPGRTVTKAEERSIFQLQADAPPCSECGMLMVRNGSCYKCLNCGSTYGCS